MNDRCLFHFSLEKSGVFITNNLSHDQSTIIDNNTNSKVESNKKIIVNGNNYRVVIAIKDNYILRFISSDKNHLKSKKLSIADTSSILSRAAKIDSIFNVEKKRIEENFSKFTHNIKTLCTMSIQDIEYFSPMGSTEDFNISKLSDWAIFVSELKDADQQDLAKTLMRIYKNMQHILNDIGVYEYLFDEVARDSRIPRVNYHSIHKVITRSVLCCASLLLEKSITMQFGKADWPVKLDYANIQVALFYIMDNIIKYTKPKTNVEIEFHKDKVSKKTRVHLKMESLFVAPDEYLKIFEEGYSGRQAKESLTNGSGLGMFIAKRLLEENAATIRFSSTGKISSTFLNRNYGHNEIIIEFE